MSHPDLRGRANGRLGIMSPVNHDLVINPVSVAEMAGRSLEYHGGATMLSPRACLVFVNDFWDDWTRAEDCTRDLMEGGYLDPLRAYGSGSGRYVGAYFIGASLSNPATQTDLRVLLADRIMTGELPAPDDNLLYIMCLPDGLRTVFDGDVRGSCEAWCGYHTHGWTPDNRRFIYSVQPAATCASCGGWDAFNSWTMVLAHEIAEAVTDPMAQGWYDDADGSENADIVAWIRHQYGPWTVQGYWTNETGDTVGEYVPRELRGGWQPEPEPEPQPEPQPEPGPEPEPHSDEWRAGVEAVRHRLAELHDATPESDRPLRMAFSVAHNVALEMLQ